MSSIPAAAGRFEIETELGRGGMGIVSAVFDTVRGERVALKRLSSERFKTAAELERATTLFEREYHTLSQLAHPNIISVFDYGVDGAGPFYTMERLSGQSLRACAPLPWAEACGLIRDVASALALVHSRRLVHRDVTPLNIYRSADGTAKLIDFGAMIPVGVAKDVVGTPAFIAPECLQQQPLDGQTDLYSLGACLYFALSGRHAYPAHDIASLREIWQTPPVRLASLVPEIPEALEVLVVALLSLSTAGRPPTAADVYEGLTGIADLPRSEHVQVGRAYVTKPALVGREPERAKLRERAERARAGRGQAVLIQSAPGMGRTRLLDAALLEAKLCGLRVARADASDAQGAGLGAVARLLRSLAAEGLAVADGLQRHGLNGVLSGEIAGLLGEARRDETLRTLCQLFFELSERAPIAIALDDLQSIDEPSLAVLASLAAQVRGRRLLVVSALADDALQTPSAALRLIRDTSKPLVLEALDAQQCRLLLSSMFGEVRGLDLLSTLIHERCLGSPRLMMDAAEAVIAAALVRYEGGSWLITANVASITHALDRLTDLVQLLEPLSHDARELLEVLALDRDAIMRLGDYPALTSHRDGVRMHRALSECIETGWLIASDDHSAFRREDQRRMLASQVDPALARTLHVRLAERCGRPELPPIYRAYHLVAAGLFAEAVVPMDEMTTFVEADPNAEIVRNPIVLETIEIFSELRDIEGAHPAAQANYAAVVVINAIYRGLPERAVPKIAFALAELSRFTGVDDYLAVAQLPEPERLTQALTRANERCQQPGIGGMDLIRLIRRQTQLCITSAVCAEFMADPSLLVGLPDLSPFAPLAPALGFAVQVIDGLSKLAHGQTWLAWDALAAAQEQLEGPASASIDRLTLMALEAACLGFLCTIEAELGSSHFLAHQKRFAPLVPNNAESALARFLQARGDVAGAAAARKRTELLSVQTHSLLETRNTEAAAYATLYALSDDLIGLRHVQGTLVEVARARPGWRPRAALLSCHILRCQGRIGPARDLIAATIVGLDHAHVAFAACAATHLELLATAAQFEDALAIGSGYLERLRLNGSPTYRVELALARAHAGLNHDLQAEALFESASAALLSRKIEGLVLGHAYETGARIALQRCDAPVFEARAELCARHFDVTRNASLALRHAALMRDAARAGLPVSGIWDALRMSSDTAMTEALRDLALLTNDSEFHARALELLVRSAGANAGFLYLRRPEGLRLAARTQSSLWTSNLDLDGEAERCLANELAGDESTQSDEQEAAAMPLTTGTSPSGLWTCPLARHEAGTRLVEGVVLLAMPPATVRRPRPPLLEELALLITIRTQHTAEPEVPSDTQ